MMSMLQSLAAFLFALAVLITFHELGHFWVARLFNVKILRFSVGFGKALWMRRFGPDRSEFVVAALPIGGYVKMLDEREGEVKPEERHRAFNRRPVMQRIAIVAAGPVFNFIFAVFAYWVMFVAGIPGLKPVVDEVEPQSIAARGGIRPGDQILSVDGRRTVTWASVMDVAVGDVVEGQDGRITVLGEDGRQRDLVLGLSRISVDEMAGGRLLGQLGIAPRRPVLPAVIGKVISGGAAARAGLRTGDQIVAADGEPVREWGRWVELVKAHPGKTMTIEVARNGETLTMEITPEALRDEQGAAYGRIGAAVDASEIDRSLMATERYGIVAALGKGAYRTGEMSLITLRVLAKMIIGEASVKNLSGPISIAQYAGESAGVGLMAFLGFLAIVSVSLGVLNLLPIPLLDGGHLMYYLIEIFKGSPVSESAQAIGQQVGLAVLLGLMGLAFYNDILRLIG